MNLIIILISNHTTEHEASKISKIKKRWRTRKT